MMNTAPVAPQRESVLGASGGARARPPAAVLNRQVVAKTTPPPPPIPFERRQQALAGNPGHPLDHAAVQSIRQSQPVTQRNWVRPAAAVNKQGPPPERPRPGNVDQPQRVQQERQQPRPEQHQEKPQEKKPAKDTKADKDKAEKDKEKKP
jgi:hypothetical protein